MSSALARSSALRVSGENRTLNGGQAEAGSFFFGAFVIAIPYNTWYYAEVYITLLPYRKRKLKWYQNKV
jgi:hypothetical protein